jgi:predicted DNA-binding protein (UPF0251 family)
MRSKIATLALAGTLGLTGVAGAVFVAPAISYAATGDSSALDDRVASIRDALKGLVSDGTITQSQADEVADALAQARPDGLRGGPGGHLGGGPRLGAAVAEALDMTAEQLRAAAEQGTTLAELADQQGVSEDALVEALVSAMQERLAEAVSAGRLTQAEADERAAEAKTRITDSLDEPLRLGRGHHGHHGGHHRWKDGPGTAPAPSQSPSQSPSTAPSASASPSADA